MILSDQNKNLITLARWLGPWASETQSPAGISRIESYHPVPQTDQKVKLWTYRDSRRPATGAYLLGPGLHFRGAAHDGLDRFARILAKAGHLVVSPFISDFSQMHIQPKSHLPFLGAFDALNAHEYLPPGIKPGVFGISFGSWLAMKLATCERRNRIKRRIFGGYGNFREAVNFAVTGELHGTHRDTTHVMCPRYTCTLHTLGLDPKVLQTAWLRYSGNMADRRFAYAGGLSQKARALAKELPTDFRNVFRRLWCTTRSRHTHSANPARLKL